MHLMLANHLVISYSIYVIKRKGITMIQGMQMEVNPEQREASLVGAKAFYTISCRNNNGDFYDCVDSFDDVDVANRSYERLVQCGWDHINMFRQMATVRLMHGISLSDRTLVRHQHSNVTIGAVA
jgi:hypothetical protein